MLANAGIPVVEIMDADGDPIDAMVGISHRRAGRLMGEEIVKSGYRRVAFLGTKMPLDHRARKRFEGFRRRWPRPGSRSPTRNSMPAARPEGPRDDQSSALAHAGHRFLCLNDMIGAGEQLLSRRASAIPGSLGLAGFNNVNLLKGLPRMLATMDACRLEIGTRAASIVAARALGIGEVGEQRVVLTPGIIRGDTLRAAID